MRSACFDPLRDPSRPVADALDALEQSLGVDIDGDYDLPAPDGWAQGQPSSEPGRSLPWPLPWACDLPSLSVVIGSAERSRRQIPDADARPLYGLRPVVAYFGP